MQKSVVFALTLAFLAIGYSAAATADDIVGELPEDMVDSIKKEGEDAKAPHDEKAPIDDGEDGEDMEHYAEDEAPSAPGGGPAPPPPNGYMVNCVTLRAYATATVDHLDDFSEHSLSFMKDVLEALATSKVTADCETVLDQEVAKLESSGPGIRHGMLEAFKHSMHDGNGVLIWHTVPKKDGEYVYIDSKRIGLGHQVPMLMDPHDGLAIHPHVFTDAAKEINAEKHITLHGATKEDDGHYSASDYKKLFKGNAEWDGQVQQVQPL